MTKKRFTKKKLIEFIKNNSLNFNTSGSGLNSACVIISGYALYIDALEVEIGEAIEELFPKADYKEELDRVFDFALRNNYGAWWITEEAEKMYKF
jgi:hypothetical protein